MGNKAKKTESNFPWKELLTFLGIIIAAYIGYLGVRSQIEIPIQATQTAEAKLTFVSPITSTTSVLPEQSDTLTPPESASLSTPSTNKILFDTTHQEWGALYGFGDRNIVKALGYEIDLLELPAYSTINTANLSSVIPNEAINFEFSTTDNYPVIGIWLTEAPASTNVSLQSSNEIFETFLWDDGNYTDAAFFQNTAGEWKVSIAPAKAGNYEIQVSSCRLWQGSHQHRLIRAISNSMVS
jgi:hypothetical protein